MKRNDSKQDFEKYERVKMAEWGECVWFMLIEERGFEEEQWLECWLPLKAPRLCWEKPNQASTTGHSSCFTRLGLEWLGQLGHKLTLNDLKVTPIILLTASTLLSTNQFFGEPIQCDLPAGGVSAETLRSYCWMYSTFSMPAGFQVGRLTVFKLSILVFAQLKDCPGSLRLFPQAKPSCVHLACENITPARKCIFKFCAVIWHSKYLSVFCPRPSQKTEPRICIYFILSNTHNMFRLCALTTWYLINYWEIQRFWFLLEKRFLVREAVPASLGGMMLEMRWENWFFPNLMLKSEGVQLLLSVGGTLPYWTGLALLLPQGHLALPGGQPHEAPGRQRVQVRGGREGGGEVQHLGGHLHCPPQEQVQQILLCISWLWDS